MQRYSEVIGLPVICFEDGKRVGNVKNIIFCPKRKKLLALLLEYSSYEITKRLVLIHDIQSIGSDAVVISDESVLRDARKSQNTIDFVDRGEVIGLKVYSRDGKDMGIIKDVVFDYKTGGIEGVEISDSLFQDIVKGRSVMPLIGNVEFGKEAVIVDKASVEEITETGGGLVNILAAKKDKHKKQK